MHPSPMAETSKLLFPSLRVFNLNPFSVLNVKVTLLRLGTAVARYLASPVVILLEIAQRTEVKEGVTRRIEPLMRRIPFNAKMRRRKEF